MNFFVIKKHLFIYTVCIILAAVFFSISPEPTYAAIDWSTCRTEGGTTQLTSGQLSNDFTLQTPITDTSKAFLLVASSGTNAVREPSRHLVTGHIKDNNTLHFHRQASQSTAELSYQLVECFNNEISVQRGVATLDVNQTSVNATINAIDTNKSFVIVSSRTDASQKNQDEGIVLGWLANSATVNLKRGSAAQSPTIVRYEVVTFSSESGVTVEHGNMNMGHNDSFASATISSHPKDQSWMYCSWNSNSGELRANALGCELVNDTTVESRRYGSLSQVNNEVHFSVIRFPENTVSVEHGTQANSPTGSDNNIYHHDIAITPVYNTERAFAYVMNTTSGPGTAYPRGRWIYFLLNTSTLRTTFWRPHSQTYDDNVKYWQVVEFPRDTTPAVPSILSVESGTRNPSIVADSYNGLGNHISSSWSIVTTPDCANGNEVWNSTINTVQKKSITVNAINGIFNGSLLGETQLAKDTIYYVCVLYSNEYTSSAWSSAFEFNTNVLPVAQSVIAEGGETSILLSPGLTTTVESTVTVQDDDSCEDILSVDAKLYRTNVGRSGADNDNNRYTLDCTPVPNTCTDATDIDMEFTCQTDMQYFADPTDSISPQPDDSWTVSVAVTDEVGSSTYVTDTIEVASVSAISAVGDMTFTGLQPGRNSGSSNQFVRIINRGNINSDLFISAYGSIPGDGLAMSCTVGGIPLDFQKFSTTPFDHNLQGRPSPNQLEEVDFDIPKATDASGSELHIYFSLGIPEDGAKGQCSGFIDITASADPLVD